MRHELPDYWSIELDDSIEFCECSDGTTILESPTISVRAIVYTGKSANAQTAVRQQVGRNGGSRDYFDDTVGQPFAGRVDYDNAREDNLVCGVAAWGGHVLEILFSFDDFELQKSVIEMWRSVRHDPPNWVKQCVAANPPLIELRDAVEGSIWPSLSDAIQRIQERRQFSQATDALLAAIVDARPGVRANVCQVLGAIGERREDLMAALRGRLHDEEIDVRAWAADALINLGGDPASVVPAMIDGLLHPEPPLPKGDERITPMCSHLRMPKRRHAARILEQIGEAARPAIPALRERLYDESGFVRLKIIRTLLRLGEPVADVWPAIIDGLRGDVMSVREQVMFADFLVRGGYKDDALNDWLQRVVRESIDATAQFKATQALIAAGVMSEKEAKKQVSAIWAAEHERRLKELP